MIEEIIQQYLEDDNEALRHLIKFFLEKVMDVEITEQTGAIPYQRASGRIAHRNGYKKRSLKTRVGELELNKPQIREFPFQTKVFDRYQRVEKAMINAVAESYLQGVSTRKIRNIVDQLSDTEISASSVSNIAKELDEKVNEFLTRPIEEEIVYLFIDATYFKVRKGARYINEAFFIAIGIRKDGYREILGAMIADSEDSVNWEAFFEDLKSRGLRGVKLVISDGHKGIKKAVEKEFLGASWQLCVTHFMRSVLKRIRKKDKTKVINMVKKIFEGDYNEGIKESEIVSDKLREMGYDKAANAIERDVEFALTYKGFPREHWKRIRTTNLSERINKEIKRRSRVVGAFPNDDSFLRLAVSILMDINEEWITGMKYLTFDDLEES